MAKLKLRYPEFRHAPSAICGSGSVRSLADVHDGATVYLISRQRSVVALLAEALARCGGSLTAANSLSKPEGEPSDESILTASEFLRASTFRRIVAVGGGSVLDWARLAWAHSIGALDLASDTSLRAFHTEQRPELWLVPTTCATGAEAADVAVFRTATGTKRAIVSRAFAADKAVLDGRFLEGIPPPQLAAFLCDALSHSLEASLSLVPLTIAKEIAISALQMILAAHPKADGSSRRDRFMEAGFLGGLVAANCSVGVVHAFAHSIGADGMGHGLANACALTAGLEFNADTLQMRTLLDRLGLESAAQLAVRVAPIVDEALADIARHPLAIRLQQEDYRKRVAERMAADVAIRSNPRPASSVDLIAFAGAVAQRVAQS